MICGNLYCKCCTKEVYFFAEDTIMNKKISISIRVSKEDLNKLKKCSRTRELCVI